MAGRSETCERPKDQGLYKAGRSGTPAGRTGTRVWLYDEGLDCSLTKRDLSMAG
jgi:hypothetical protein